MLSNTADFTGGTFETSESDDYLLAHPFEKGDLLVFLSHKYHRVAPVEAGERHVLVAEIWEGAECTIDGRCESRNGDA